MSPAYYIDNTGRMKYAKQFLLVRWSVFFPLSLSFIPDWVMADACARSIWLFWRKSMSDDVGESATFSGIGSDDKTSWIKHFLWTSDAHQGIDWSCCNKRNNIRYTAPYTPDPVAPTLFRMGESKLWWWFTLLWDRHWQRWVMNAAAEETVPVTLAYRLPCLPSTSDPCWIFYRSVRNTRSYCYLCKFLVRLHGDVSVRVEILLDQWRKMSCSTWIHTPILFLSGRRCILVVFLTLAWEYLPLI